MDIIIRNINLETDIQGIREAHGSDEHWGSDEACFRSGQTSLENGFFIQVAVCDDKIVGHAEWVLSDEPLHRFLYLSMLQTHEAYQKRGIGTKLIESGAAYARDNNCAFLRTMPDDETGSDIFYQKNGFVQTKDSNKTLKLETTSAPIENAVRIDKVPFTVVKTLPFVIGLYQHASAHIWKVYNAQHEYDDRTVSSFKIGESYINIGAFEPTEQASVTCWSKQITPALIAEILAVGGSLGYKYLNFCILDENTPCFNTFDYEISEDDDDDVFMERPLINLLKRITYKETFDSGAEQYKSVRVVLLDDKNLVSVLYVGKVKFYTLPGGGIDEGETPEQAAIREVLEETGCDSEIICNLGIIEENSKTCSWNGINTCFLAKMKGEQGVQNLTEIETDEETQVQWYDLHEALKIISNQKISARDEREAGIGLIIQERDIILLNEVIKIMEKTKTATHD